jgi:hypothetical protein
MVVGEQAECNMLQAIRMYESVNLGEIYTRNLDFKAILNIIKVMLGIPAKPFNYFILKDGC